MTRAIDGPLVRYAGWFLRRNPLYLLSAVAMAVGARLFLVGPGDVAGDISLIVQTLVFVQFYEWAVSFVLVCLNRHARSPEDKPSLLLVLAAFWTGPLAATIELTVMRPVLGTAIAAGVSLVAIAELRVVCQQLGLRISRSAQALAMACLVLIVGVPFALRIMISPEGDTELVLYAAWAGIAGISLLSLRSPRLRPAGPHWEDCRGRAVELTFIGICLVATALHLCGMNHAFDCHARLFYASPLVLALAAIGMQHLQGLHGSYGRYFFVFAFAPAVAIGFALQGFHVAVPAERFPVWLRDPMVCISALAAAVWWFGFNRCRMPALLHCGSAALGLCAFRVLKSLGSGMEWGVSSLGTAAGHDARLWVVLYAIFGYLLLVAWWRRSRITALLAVIIHFAGVYQLVWGRTPADALVVSFLAGWGVLLVAHLTGVRPRLPARILAILWLLSVSWYFDNDPVFGWVAQLHEGMTIIILLLAGQVWLWTRYRAIAICLIVANLVRYGGEWAMNRSDSDALLVVVCAFVLLSVGFTVSWHKQRILELIGENDVAEERDLYLRSNGNGDVI